VRSYCFPWKRAPTDLCGCACFDCNNGSRTGCQTTHKTRSSQHRYASVWLMPSCCQKLRYCAPDTNMSNTDGKRMNDNGKIGSLRVRDLFGMLWSVGVLNSAYSSGEAPHWNSAALGVPVIDDWRGLPALNIAGPVFRQGRV
jgi:hypothetical protein